jgi:hypothetical protein
MLKYERFTEIGGQLGSNVGGIYRRNDGTKWYLKQPNSERQAVNEVMASRFYKEMGFDAVQYHHVDNGMVASRWREDLPQRSTCQDLATHPTVREAFLPSVYLENWDVIGLQYENTLYDPEEMGHPVFLDFGGSFDTRAMGGHKQFSATNTQAVRGFTDPGVNASAHCVFDGMTRGQFERSKDRVRSISERDIGGLLEEGATSPMDGRRDKLHSRRSLVLSLDYDEVW